MHTFILLFHRTSATPLIYGPEYDDLRSNQGPSHKLDTPQSAPECTFIRRWDVRMHRDPRTSEDGSKASPDNVPYGSGVPADTSI